MDPLQSSEILPLVRAKVRENLMRSAAFNELPPEKRAEIAHHTVKAMHYILGGADGESRPASVTIAGPTPLDVVPPGAVVEPFEDPAGDTASKRLGESGAVAANQGADALAGLVESVDFPSFVAGLIDGVFNAIVTSSIKQMEAYADLVKNVSKSVDQYMKDNVTENNARDYLAERYPSHLEIDIDGDSPQLRAREGYDEDNLPDFASDLGLEEPMRSIEDDEVEKKLVPAARRRIAMDRQQLLATMVMMGVNRLVVTRGNIEASVLFELDTKDEVKKKYSQRTTSDWEQKRQESGVGFGRGGGLFGRRRGLWFSRGSETTTSSFKVTTTRSEDSTAKVELHAKLGGKVNVEFKSDYFPMEKMVDVFQINQIREKTPAAQAPQGAVPAPPVAAPPKPAAPARA